MTETETTKKKPETEEKEMTFWEHLEELRWHAVRSVSAIIIMAIVAFLNRQIIFDVIILAPRDSNFFTYRFFCWLGHQININGLCFESLDIKIINYNIAGQFMTHIYISFVAGLVLATPYVVWEIWRFLKPALRPKERRYASGAVIVISFLFLLGVLFGYFVMAPMTINFFGTYYVSSSVENQIALSSFISSVVSAAISCGAVFELPVFVFFLARVGILTPAFMKRTRKYSIVIILILSAIITPPNVFSQIIVSIPLYFLFEFSIWVSKFAVKEKVPAG
ncbi:MAG: twin-arginine translocase subunit TatC [Bacteroidales bacterium]